MSSSHLGYFTMSLAIEKKPLSSKTQQSPQSSLAHASPEFVFTTLKHRRKAKGGSSIPATPFLSDIPSVPTILLLSDTHLAASYSPAIRYSLFISYTLTTRYSPVTSYSITIIYSLLNHIPCVLSVQCLITTMAKQGRKQISQMSTDQVHHLGPTQLRAMQPAILMVPWVLQDRSQTLQVELNFL